VHRASFFLAAFFVGCASADEPSSGTPDASAETVGADTSTGADVAVDSAAPKKDADLVDVSPDVIFPVEDIGAPGACGIPAGTTATATATAGTNAPANAIDGKTGTFWSSGNASGGTLRLAFPKATRFDRVRIAARSVLGSFSPTFTLLGRVTKMTPVTIGTAKVPVTPTVAWVPEFKVTAGTYDGLDVTIASSSLVLIGEVFVYDSTAGCTPP